MKNFAKSSFSILKTALSLIILSIIVIFMINNRAMVTVEMFPMPIIIETRLFMLMILCFLLGALFGFFIFTTNHIKSLFNRQNDDKKDKNNG